MPVTRDNANYNNTNNYNIAIVTTKTMMKKKLFSIQKGWSARAQDTKLRAKDQQL